MAIGLGTVLAQRYRADALLGRGGMGEVWRCRDLEQGHDVAIKAVRPEMLSEPGTARLFHSEVVAVARLNHPGIIPVYDLLHDELGSALLVMEFREGAQLGVLGDEDPPFSILRDVLVQVLEALAYAHARGVLHLDIKPENVLLERSKKGALLDDGRALRATLLDFGIARVRRPGRGLERWFERDAVIGTIEYMAPEQCTGTFERLGPWSDLFSVGAVAFELCAGRRPFPGASDHAGLIRRLREPPPRLVPMLAGVPPAFPELCAAMLALDPRDRPSSAADVLGALREMEQEPDPVRDAGGFAPRPQGQVEISTLEHGVSARLARPSAVTLPVTGPDMLAQTEVVEDSVDLEPSVMAYAAPVAVTAPVPSWRGTTTAARPAEAQQAFTAEALPPPAGAYGLFGLRDLPVLGRTEERLSVWSAVRAAAVERRTRVVLLEGPAGVGKSRLARDAMERAVELGLCAQMQTSWSADGSGDEGLRGLLENLLDSRGAPAKEVHARLAFWLDRVAAEDRRRDPQASAGLRGFISADQRSFTREVELLLRPPRDAAPDAGLPLRVALEAIIRAAAVRPVLLWLDDVQWSRGEAAALFTALRAESPELPVCVIATVRSEEIADRAAYELMAATAGTDRVLVDKLDLEATRSLVRGLLEVDEELCELLALRAEGNPLFVSLMLRQLVMAEAVGRRDGRYRLTRSFDLSKVPGDIEALLGRRIEHSGADRRELGALALVRDRVSLEVARELTRARGRALDDAIGKALTGGLLRIEGGAYVWEHGLLRERLVKGIPAAEAPALHGAAAAALAPLVDREDVQEERALHLRAAGRAREACEAMRDAGLWSLRRAAPAPRKSRFEALAAWAKEARLLDLEARGLAELGFAWAEVGDAKQAAEALATARLLIERGAGEEAAAWLVFRQSQALRLQGRVDDGTRVSREALAAARRAGVGEVERQALAQLGLDYCRSKNDVEGRPLLDEAARLARAAGDSVVESMALRTLTHFEPDPATALALAERAIEVARAAGALRVELTAKQVWVAVLWRAGDQEGARREARALAEEAGRRALRQTVSLLELQCASWAALCDDWPDARAHLDAAIRWGAAGGAITERLVLAAIEVNLALLEGDEAAAQVALEMIERTRGDFDDQVFRQVVGRAAGMAKGAMGDRLRVIAGPAEG